MKIIKAEITAFGKYRQQTIDFSCGNQLFYGANETGKSTLYQFIQAILFGFPSKGRKKKDYTPRDGAAFGGKLWLEHPIHGTFVVERYRQQNRGKAKVSIGEQIGDEQLLKELLAPLTRELFQQVFTFQQEQLAELDQLHEKELHDALISLGITGSSAVFKKRQEYYQHAQQLFKKKGQKLPLNQALSSWQTLKTKIQEKQKQEEIFSKLVQQTQTIEKQLSEIRQKMEEADEQLTLLHQQELNFSLYEEWQELKRKVVEEVPEESLIDGLQQFYTRYQQVSERIEELEHELEKHSGMDQQSAKYYFFLEKETELKEISQLHSDVKRYIAEIRSIDQDNYLLESEVANLSRKWNWSEKRMPQQFLHSKEWQSTNQKREEILKELQQEEIRKEINHERYQKIEQEVTLLEEQHPFLVQTQIETHIAIDWRLVVATIVCLLATFLLPTPWRFVTLFLALGISGYSFIKYKQATPEAINQAIKGSWQEKLGQLDLIAESIAQSEAKKEKLHQEESQMEQFIFEFSQKLYLGDMNTFANMDQFGYEVENYQQMNKKLQESFQQKENAEHFLNQVEQKLLVLSDWLPIQGKPLEEKMNLLNDFLIEMEQLKFARSYQQNTLLSQQINQEKSKQKNLMKENTPFLIKAGLSYPSEIPIYLQKIANQQQEKARLEELNKLLSTLFPKKITKQVIDQQLEKIAIQKNNWLLEQEALGEQNQRLQLQIEALQKDGTLDELYQQESQQKAYLEELMIDWGAHELAGTVLGDLSTEMSERQLPQLIQQTGMFLQELTNGAYQEVRIIDDVLYVVDDYQVYSIYDLSTGTKDQLIMAIRFAYLYLESEKRACPIIIDDGWLHYDHQRKAQLAKILAKFGRDYQVICFSSDKEMVSYYQELKQPIRNLEGVINEKTS